MSKLSELLRTLVNKVNSAVKTEPQTLTEEQKAQVRENIGVSEGCSGSSQAIIDVVELPTENIQEGVFYRLLTVQVATYGEIHPYYNGIKFYAVDGLPETGEVVTDAEMNYIVGYYNTQDESIYGYLNDAVGSAFGTPAGWYPFDALAQIGGVAWGGIISSPWESYNREGPCAILVREFYLHENNHWVKIPTASEYPPSIDISWDGEIGDRFAMDIESLGYDPGTYLVKMSDDVIHNDQFYGSIQTLSNYEYDRINTNIDIDIDESIPGVYNIGAVVVVYAADATNSALGFPDGMITDGIYFMKTNEVYVKNFKTEDGIRYYDRRYLDLVVQRSIHSVDGDTYPTGERVEHMINSAIGSAIGGSY